MNRALKIVVIIVALLVALLVIFAIVIQIMITPERVKATVVPIAEKKLHRQIQIGDIKVSIFSGIVLNNLIVQERGGGTPFVKAAQARLKYQFWPLFSRRVVIDQVLLDAPSISIIRMADGSFNYSDITAKKAPEPAEAKPEGKKELNLLVSQVSVTKGALRFEDRRGNSQPPPIYTIDDFDFSASNISLHEPFSFTSKARVIGTAIEFKGEVAGLGEKPTINADFRVPDGDLRKIATMLPQNLAAKAKLYDPAGSVKVRLHLVGPVSTPKGLVQEGEIRLEKIQATASGQRPTLDGVLYLKAQTLSSKDLTLSVGSNKVDINLSVANLLGKPLSVTSTVKADQLDLGPLLKKGKPATGTDEKEKPEPGPLKLPVTASGTVQVGQTTYKGLPISQFFLKYRLLDNVLSVDELRGKVAGGSFSDTARVDLGQKGFVYSTRLVVQGVQADPVVSAFVPKAAGTVYGTLSLNAEVNGKGTKTPAIKENAAGKGNFAVTQGKLTGSGLVKGLAQFINLEQLRVVQFNKFAGTFNILDGKVVIDSGVSGRDLQITPKGTAGLDSSLDLSLETRIAPQLTSKITGGGLNRFVTDDKGWGILPLKVKGSFSAPQFRLDISGVRQQLKQKGKEKLEQTIQEKLLKKKEGEPQRPERELLEKGLRGILGK